MSNKNLFLAKSNPKETIMEHTDKLLDSFYLLKSIYPNLKNINWELLRIACIYHDVGKMNTKFQNKIIGNINNYYKDSKKLEQIELLEDKLIEIEEIPHGYLSNSLIPRDFIESNFTKEEISILYESIFYHHNREKLEGNRKKELLKVIREDLSRYKDEFKYDKLIDNNIEISTEFMRIIKKRILIENSILNSDQYEIASKFIITKGLLNKIDFAASSDVKVEIEPGNLTYLTKKSIEPYKLNDLQEYMEENKDENLIIVASTGIGKTEGALLWIGDNKGFFTLPLRVSINSIYDRVVSKISYGKDKTALLHSDSVAEYMKREAGGVIEKNYLDATRQLSYPLTICTLDQLIGFIFKYEGFELKLATLSYSKTVIDEIQMYSPEMIGYLIIALRDIVRMGGKFAIVTATFPPIFEYFMEYVGIKNNYDYKKCSKPFLKMENNKVMLRHKVKVYEENIAAEKIKNEYKGQKVLVIVNTVNRAQELYNELISDNEFKDKVFMFHSRFIKEDRYIKEKFIFRDGQLKNDFSGVWITTQVVEASLDIDFDVLYTELSDISGLLQRMGRVFRSRSLLEDRVNINVFVGNSILPSGIRENTSKYDSIIDIDIFNKSKEAILKYNDMQLNELEKMKLVEEVYSVENLENSNYFKTIKSTINDYQDIIPYDLKKNEKRLRDIVSKTIIPSCIYEINKDKINEIINRIKLAKDFSERVQLKEELMKKTLSISESIFDTVKREGGILESIEINSYETIYLVKGDYSFSSGYTTYRREKGFSEDQFA